MRVFDRGVWKEAKACAQCQRSFTERKKWPDFSAVKYCSDKCKQDARRTV